MFLLQTEISSVLRLIIMTFSADSHGSSKDEAQ